MKENIRCGVGFVVYTMGNSIACLCIDGNDPITSKKLKMQQREGIIEEVLRMKISPRAPEGRWAFIGGALFPPLKLEKWRR